MRHFLAILVTVATFGLHLLSGQTVMMTDRAAARFLDQATWGPTADSLAQLQQVGISAWLAAQFALNTSDLPDQPILNAQGKNNGDMTPIEEAFFENTVTVQDQLRQRVAFALSQQWVVSSATLRPAYAFPPYWRLFRDNAFGNYRDIMKALTLSPAMGNYLNMANNNKANPNKNTAPNENYARELMQLFTVGLNQLRPDGSPVLDSNNNPVPTYTQAIVSATARALTGWTYPVAPDANPKNNNPAYYFGQMYSVEAEHDQAAKTIIGGVNIPSGTTAEQDLDTVLDALLKYPSTAPFVSKQLIQHLVTSNPSPAYVQRVASIFANDGSGIAGDMQAVVTAILTDPEARAADDNGSIPNPKFGHMREPVLFVSNLLRGLNATLGPGSTVYNDSNSLGQTVFDPPTVFSYFSPLYTLESGEPAPEFDIYTAQTAIQRANIVNAALYGSLDKTTKIDLTPFEQASDVDSMVDYVSYVFLHHNMSTPLRQAAIKAATAVQGAKAQAQAALYIVLTSSEYQIVQ
ncbi:MAG TPA: DUF1800 domain-containing protein [Bryobacteraceae bacterium]|nr:DUF1800 domain-containing protein [Bryobacteraceae bacterium]